MNFEFGSTACFTGHRPHYFANETDTQCVKVALKRMIAKAHEMGYTTFICGMALGVDQWAALQVLEQGLTLVAALPCHDQQIRWTWTQQLMYEEILTVAHHIHYVHDGAYYDGCLTARNQWMCDRASLVLAIWNGEPQGGTYHCIQYAQSLSRKILSFNPITAEYQRLG